MEAESLNFAQSQDIKIKNMFHFEQPENIPFIFNDALSSKSIEIKLSAPFALQEICKENKKWYKLPLPTRHQIKELLMSTFTKERDMNVRNAIAETIAIIAKYELEDNAWPELLEMIDDLITNEDMKQKELGLIVLSTLSAAAPRAFDKHVRPVAIFLFHTFASLQDLNCPVAYYTVECINNFLHFFKVGRDAEHDTIPTLLQYGEIIVKICLLMLHDESLSEARRIKVAIFIKWITSTKRSVLLKYDLIQPIANTLFNLMATKPKDDNEIYFFGEKCETLVTSATKSFYPLTYYWSRTHLDTYLKEHVLQNLCDSHPLKKKAAYLSVVILTKTCSLDIAHSDNSYLEIIFHHICQDIINPIPVIRNAALFAFIRLWNDSSLQSIMSKNCEQFLPTIIDYLQDTCTKIKLGGKQSPFVERIFFTIMYFIKDLNKNLVLHLPFFMDKLFEILNVNTPMHICKLTLYTIDTMIISNKDVMVPYIQRISDILTGYCPGTFSDGNLSMQIQVVDIACTLLSTYMREQNLEPLATTFLKVGINVLHETNDPELKKYIYKLFLKIIIVLKRDIDIILPKIIEVMLYSIKCMKRFTVSFEDKENMEFFPYEYDILFDKYYSGKDVDITWNDFNKKDVIKNEYEKKKAVLTLREIAECTRNAFQPFLERCFEELLPLVYYPQECTRKEVIDTLMYFCIISSEIDANNNKENITQKLLGLFFPLLINRVELDVSYVACNAINSLSILLDKIKFDVFITEPYKHTIMDAIKTILKGYTHCEDSVCDQETLFEIGNYLVKYTCNVVTNFGKLLPSNEFLSYFRDVLPLLIDRLNKSVTEYQKSDIIYTISECFSDLKENMEEFIPKLLPQIMIFIHDPNEMVMNNAIFGIGKLALCKKGIEPYYNRILQDLATVIIKQCQTFTHDSVVCVIARLIIINSAILPLEEVFPLLINQLPLQPNFEKIKDTFSGFLSLYRTADKSILPNIKVLLENEHCTDEIGDIIEDFLQNVQHQFAEEWESVCSDIPSEFAAEMQELCL